jgi:hypothetical protein
MWPSHAIGDVYAVARLGPHYEQDIGSENGNYLIIYTAISATQQSTYSLEGWTVIGYAHITAAHSSEGEAYYIGTAYSNFNYVTVGVTTAFGGVDTYNDVEVDCVLVASPNPPPSGDYNTLICASAWIPDFGERSLDVYVSVDGNCVGSTGYDVLETNITPGNHTIEAQAVDSDTGQDFAYFTINDYTTSENPAPFDGYGWTIHIGYGYHVNISSTLGGSVSPSIAAGNFIGQSVPITATPDAGYALNYWLLDGVQYGANPNMDYYVLGAHDLQAVFNTTATITRYSLTVNVLDLYSNPVNVTVFVDGEAFCSNQELWVCEGYHLVVLDLEPNQVWGGQNWCEITINQENSPMVIGAWVWPQ